MSLMGVTSYVAVAEDGAWQHVQTQVLGAGAASVSFTGLAGAAFYMLTAFTVKDNGGSNPALAIRLNNDSGANYAMGRVLHNAAGRTGSSVSGQTSWASAVTMGASGLGGGTWVISKPAAGVRGQMWAAFTMDTTALALVEEREFGDWNNVAATISRIDMLVAADQLAAGTSIRLDRKRAA